MIFKREIIPFTTEEAWFTNRKQDLTSTDIADLFGCGYSNYEELFHRKIKGLDSSFVPNERSDWGKALEPCIAKEFARQNNWNIRPAKEYMRIPELRIGSSFDYVIGTGDHAELMEVKNVAVEVYKKDWAKGFSIEAPAKIELQIQTQLLVSQLSKCYLCVLVGGNQGIPLLREPNPKIQSAILVKVADFWKRIDNECK